MTLTEEKAIEDQFVRHERLIGDLRAEVTLLRTKISNFMEYVMPQEDNPQYKHVQYGAYYKDGHIKIGRIPKDVEDS